MQNFQYDGLSRMTSPPTTTTRPTPNDDSTVTDAYDSLGRIIEETQQIGGQPTQAIDSAWRADDLRSSLTYPNGRVEVYTYDTLSRLKTVSDQGASQPIAVYDTSAPTACSSGSTPERHGGDVPRRLRDGRHRLRRHGAGRSRSATCESDNSLIVGFTYTYDRMGNKLTEGKLHDPANSETYTYDSAYRLITFQRAPAASRPCKAPGRSTAWATGPRSTASRSSTRPPTN